MYTDAAIRELIRLARRQSHLSQQDAAARAGVSRSWWKRVENATEVAVSEETLLDMLQAVGVRASHLHRIDQEGLACLMEKRELFSKDGTAKDEDLQDYLANAPASDEVKEALMITARTLSEIKRGVTTEPFADQFPPRRKDG